MNLSFQKQQHDFAARIRYGREVSCPNGISEERMHVYEECFLNGINELLSNCFPILQHILSHSQWRELIRCFYARHPSKSPLFYEIPEEFLSYLLQEKPMLEKFPFLIELAHYEWMEFVLEMASEMAERPSLQEINLHKTKVAVSNLAEIVAYNYAVHRISLNYVPAKNEQKDTYLCVYRDTNDDVKFMELNALSARLLLGLKEKPQSAIEFMKALAGEANIENPDSFINENKKIIERFLNLGILYPLN